MPSGKEIKSTQRRERRIHVELDSAGVITRGEQHVTVSVTGTGERTLTLLQPAARTLFASVHAREADCMGWADNASVSTIDINIADLAASAADKAVLIEIVALDSDDEI